MVRSLFAAVVLLAFASLARAVTMIYPVEAIDDLWTLPAEEFKQKYSGINVTGLGPTDEGWYVRYKHENLTYLFGPVADREEARRKKWEMESVRDAAVKHRSTLSTAQVDFVRFTFSGAYGKGGGDLPYGAGEGPRMSADGKSGPDGDLDGDGIPNNRDEDMDGDGVANGQDGDADGDGIPNGADDYGFGSNPAGENLAQNGGQDGQGNQQGGQGDKQGGQGDKQGGRDGQQIAGNQGQQQGGQSGSGNQRGQQMAGQQGGQQGQQGQQGEQLAPLSQPGQRVASNQRGGQQSSQGGQSGQSGQQSQSSSQSSSSGQSGQAGQPGTPSPSGGSSGSSNPLLALLRMILGI